MILTSPNAAGTVGTGLCARPLIVTTNAWVRIIHARVHECGCTTVLQSFVSDVDMSHTDAGTVEPGSDTDDTPRRGLLRNLGRPGFDASPTRTCCGTVEKSRTADFFQSGMGGALRDPAAPECNGANSNAGVDKIRAILASPPSGAPLARAATLLPGLSISGSPPQGPRHPSVLEGVAPTSAIVPNSPMCWCENVCSRPNSA